MTKTAAKLRCRALLQTVRGRVDDVDAIWLMTFVFHRHPDWAEKQGKGVSHIEVRLTGSYQSPCFWLIRSDKSEVDISYKVSLDGRGTLYAKAISAARSEIHVQITGWKCKNPAPRPGMHCDHVVPFDTVFKDWLAIVKLQPEEIQVTRQLVGHVDLFLSRDLALSWQRYHKQHASYQWLSAKENIEKSNKTAVDEWTAAYDRETARIG